ncbi:MAG: two-component system sensor histidine kinase HydH [Myxococcota bacterium]
MGLVQPLGMTPRSTPARLRNLAVASAIGLGLMVLAAAASDAWSARRLSHALADGQGALVHTALVRELEGLGATSPEALETALDDLHPLGLRWVGVLDPGNAVRVEAGHRTLALDPLPAGGALRNDGHALLGRVGTPPGQQGRSPAADGPGLPPGGPLPPGAAPRPAVPTGVVFEVEPLLAHELRGRSTREVALALAVALALVLGAFALRQALARAEALEASLARRRHLAALGEMSAVLAHELRNPLASLKGNAQLLVEVLPDQPRIQDRAAWVVREAERMERLTTDLLDFARSGGVRPEPASPATILRDAVREACDDAIIAHDGAPQTWDLDPVRVHQALSNLLKNARQACASPPPQASVTVEQDELVFAVRDHGPGLPRDVAADSLFEPFRTTKTRGTGLGLAVVARVASLHGGRVDAGDHPDGGAVFRLVLPRNRDS